MGWGMKVCSNGPGHMIKMAAMPTYGKNLKKIFSGTKRPMTFKLGMQHRLVEYSNFSKNSNTLKIRTPKTVAKNNFSNASKMLNNQVCIKP